MKNPRRTARKLTLSVTTIRQLTPGQLVDAGGGLTTLTLVTRTCPTCCAGACTTTVIRD